ncbi:heat shock protein Hsp20 [Halostagnicola larsenii XH-48]|uniref:Heat shock protein Hsp20 n=1 Tax=Halostagnicola larsenii XH-48 TaxID=797299 RepID=W0JL96_9EURY|nr:Hsp20/alpha crystallin family protein [Halostagnicola larsenii]AHF99515.1 heat shock protein Hsp20 [Halostagnicola larsenii XH-48]
MAERPNPFDGLEELFDRLSRQLQSARRGDDRETGADAGRLDMSVGSQGTGLDMTDAGDEFVVVVDVPGFERDDIEVTLTNQHLMIDGEREHAIDDSDDTYLRRERRTRSFSRQVSIPDPVDAEGVDAHLNNGVLTIRLPKLEPDEAAHSIDIE